MMYHYSGSDYAAGLVICLVIMLIAGGVALLRKYKN